MTDAATWAKLHDATLESVELQWSSGDASIHVRTGDAERPRQVVVATSVTRLECERLLPWGPSVSINEVRGPMPKEDGSFVLEIEVQSGDVLRITASAFRLRHDP